MTRYLLMIRWIIFIVFVRFDQVFGEGTDDSGPYRAPTDLDIPFNPGPTSNELRSLTDFPTAFIMSYTDLITQIKDETKTYHNIYFDNYTDTLMQYLSHHGVSPAIPIPIPTNVRKVILENIRLIVVFVVDEATNQEKSYIQTGFRLNNDDIITAQHGVGTVGLSNVSFVFSCDRQVIWPLTKEPGTSMFNDRKYFLDECAELIQINTSGVSNIDDIAFFKVIKERNKEFENINNNNNNNQRVSLFDGSFDFNANDNDNIVVCFGINGVYNNNSYTTDGVKVSLDDYMSYLGKPLDFVYSFGQILPFDDLLKIACTNMNNGFETNNCKEEYFKMNPKSVEQLKYNAYSNVTTEWGISGGYCANIFDPFKILMITSLSKYIRSDSEQSLYSFANQHTLVQLSPSTANYKVYKSVAIDDIDFNNNKDEL